MRAGVVRDDAPPLVRAETVRGVRHIISLQYVATGRDVVVTPVLVSKGPVSRDKIRTTSPDCWWSTSENRFSSTPPWRGGSRQARSGSK